MGQGSDDGLGHLTRDNGVSWNGMYPEKDLGESLVKRD